MSTFEYRGFTEAGRASRGLIEALDLKEAREKLAAQGVLTERLTEAGAPGASRTRGLRQSFSLDTRAMIYRELGSLVKAGLPLAQAMDILIGSPELGDDRSVLAAVHDRIREGAPLALSLAEASSRVTPFEQAVIEVGERAGNLEEVLNRLATFLEEQKQMQDRVATALLYPAIVLVLALGIGMAVLGLMVPRIGEMLTESQIPMPMLTRVMIALSTFFGATVLPGLAVVVLGILGLRHRVRTVPAFRTRLDRRLFGIPLAGKAYTALVNLRFSRTLALLIRGGVPLVDGLVLSGRATGSPWVESLAKTQSDAVRQGQSLAAGLREIPPLRASLPGWVEAGEASGDLSTMLESAGHRYQQQWDRIVNRFLALLEPVLVLVVGAFVLVVALSILLPVLSMNQQL